VGVSKNSGKSQKNLFNEKPPKQLSKSFISLNTPLNSVSIVYDGRIFRRVIVSEIRLGHVASSQH